MHTSDEVVIDERQQRLSSVNYLNLHSWCESFDYNSVREEDNVSTVHSSVSHGNWVHGCCVVWSGRLAQDTGVLDSPVVSTCTRFATNFYRKLFRFLARCITHKLMGQRLSLCNQAPAPAGCACKFYRAFSCKLSSYKIRAAG